MFGCYGKPEFLLLALRLSGLFLWCCIVGKLSLLTRLLVGWSFWSGRSWWLGLLLSLSRNHNFLMRIAMIWKLLFWSSWWIFSIWLLRLGTITSTAGRSRKHKRKIQSHHAKKVKFIHKFPSKLFELDRKITSKPEQPNRVLPPPNLISGFSNLLKVCRGEVIPPIQVKKKISWLRSFPMNLDGRAQRTGKWEGKKGD